MLVFLLPRRGRLSTRKERNGGGEARSEEEDRLNKRQQVGEEAPALVFANLGLTVPTFSHLRKHHSF